MKRINLFLIAAMFLAASCQREMQPTEKVTDEAPAAEATTIVKRAVVKFSEEMLSQIGGDLKGGKVMTKSSGLNDFVEVYGVKSITPVFTSDPRFVERERRYGMHQWYYIEYDPSLIPATRAAELISEIPGVEIAEPERPIVSYSTNDPYFNSQWYLKQSNGIDINVEGAWTYTKGSSNVIISVVDGGIQLDHPDLKDNVLPGGAGQSRNFVTNNYRINGDNHGTHVAGIIGASSNNSLGIAGIAGGDARLNMPGVRMMSCQIFDGDNSGNSADAIKWGADNGAVISQNSWGYTFDYNGDGVLDQDELKDALASRISGELKAAVDYFIDNAGCDASGNQLNNSPMKGGVVIFAAGNDAITNGAPAEYDRIIAVGSVKSDGERSSFSNFGSWVDICAPGSDIFSTITGSGYGNMSGTSMACPVVSGVAALVLSYRGGMGFTNTMLKDCLLKGAAKNKVSAANVGPFIDAMGAMMYGMDMPAPAAIETFTTEVLSNKITLTWTLTEGQESIPAYGAVIYASTNQASIENLDPIRPASDVRTADVQTFSGTIGQTVSGSITDLEFDKDYYVTVVPYNPGPSYSAAAHIEKVSIGKNSAPVITADIDATNLEIKSSDAVNILFTVDEPDGHGFTVSWEPGSDAELWQQMSANSYSLRINAPALSEGKYSALFKAVDSYGKAAEYHINYTVLSNNAPVVVGQIENVVLNTEKKSGKTLTMADYFSDPDEDFLSYNIENSSENAVHITTSDGIMYLTPTAAGNADITVTAMDPSGASVSQSFKILVRSGEKLVDMYPTQVVDYLYVATGEELSPVEVKVISSGGKEVRNVSASASAFEPAKIDMGDIAPGMYVVKVLFDGNEYKQNIVKL